MALSPDLGLAMDGVIVYYPFHSYTNKVENVTSGLLASGENNPLRHLLLFLGVGVLVFATSLLGILTRPEGMLAVLWPANSVFVAFLIRLPIVNNPVGWIMAFVGYVLADLLTGNDLTTSVSLAVTNMVGVGAAICVLRHFCKQPRTLQRPYSLYLGLGAAAAALSAGCFALIYGLIFADPDPVRTATYWVVTEFANYVVILPFTMTVARVPVILGGVQKAVHALRDNWKAAWHGLPAVSLLASICMADLVGGPGAIVFPVPALLWCALTYRFNQIAFLMIVMSVLVMVNLEHDLLMSLPEDADPMLSIMSTRIGIAMLVIGPLTVASIDQLRSELLGRLEHAAKHDFLTGVLMRGAFLEQGQSRIDSAVSKKDAFAVLVMDLDRFKTINDTHGHAVGDSLLTEVARVIRDSLRTDDLVARLGGEEFAVLASGISSAEAECLANTICEKVAALRVPVPNAAEVCTTISIGMLHRQGEEHAMLDDLINEADRAMYKAKETGRNRIVVG
ncbi:GGDEF domain-containing protein [Thalassospira sp. HJ]|uniref:GGDEF domain-containing protein n=1 Tax=Thalassospira sp. HJ TaxID=1616823 RepID=UPI001F320B58|nr:GGDEF domain-containing protein [Thalassospira sp. HJ]